MVKYYVGVSQEFCSGLLLDKFHTELMKCRRRITLPRTGFKLKTYEFTVFEGVKN